MTLLDIEAEIVTIDDRLTLARRQMSKGMANGQSAGTVDVRFVH